MKLKQKLKMNLVLNLRNKITWIILLALVPCSAMADLEIAGELLPPASAAYVTDTSIINKLNIGPDDEPIWCYSGAANSILITAPERERQRCSLSLSQKLEEASVDCSFKIESLKLELESLRVKNENLLLIKDQEIEKLTTAALKRPGDYSLYWATGGLAVGIIGTVLVFLVAQ